MSDAQESTESSTSLEEKKECRHCFDFKPISAFGKNYAAPDGLRSICRACRSTDRKRLREKARNTQQAKERQREAQGLPPEKKVALTPEAKASRRYYRKNRIAILTKRKKERAANRARLLAIEMLQ